MKFCLVGNVLPRSNFPSIENCLLSLQRNNQLLLHCGQEEKLIELIVDLNRARHREGQVQSKESNNVYILIISIDTNFISHLSG